ncbi:MAG: tetratricopeptide repeat protein, partial [Lysobacterales bacterium]
MYIQRLLTILLVLALLSPGIASCEADAGAEDVDYLALAALMLRDGNLDRALSTLDAINIEEEGLDLPRYYTLRGMTYLRRNEMEQARDAFLKARDLGSVDAVVHVYLAQIQFQLQDYGAAIDSLDRAGAAVERVPSTYHMRAQCYWLMKDPVMALATLDVAEAIFPEDSSFLRRKVFFLIDMGLFREAAILGRQYLEKSAGGVEDYVALGNALRASGDLDEAGQLLEQAQLMFPDSAEVKKVLAHVYIDRGELNAAADVLYQA